MNVTAINVFVEMDGMQCMAPIDPRMADMFIASLPMFQRSEQANAGVKLVTLPLSVVEPLLETRRAFVSAVAKVKQGKRVKGGAA